MENKNLSFGEAIKLMEKGIPVCRSGWNGKGMFVFKQLACDVKAEIVPGMTSLPSPVKEVFMDRFHNRKESMDVDPIEFNTLKYRNQFAIVYPDNHIYGWVASPSDISSNDWEVYSPKVGTKQ